MVIDVATWPQDEEYPIFPVGSKPKRALLCPEGETAPFLRSGHRYLFKAAEGWQAQQLWSEVIAYELSRALGLNVPPAFAAFDSRSGTAGVLVEFFYGYPGTQETSRFVHASDFMQENFAHHKKGRPHAVRENLAICRVLKVGNHIEWWGQALIFDTLIGNVDRHSQNWGFLFKWHEGAMSVSLAPLYDNGTSLGYGVAENKLSPSWTPARVDAFIRRGKHDCGWSRDDDGPMSHLVLTSRYVVATPSIRGEAERLLSLKDEAVEDVVRWGEKFTLPISFSAARAEFIYKQVTARRDALLESIGS